MKQLTLNFQNDMEPSGGMRTLSLRRVPVAVPVPFSLAGKRRGTEDYCYLWPAMLDVIPDCSDQAGRGQNVYGIVNWSEGLVFEQVR